MRGSKAACLILSIAAVVLATLPLGCTSSTTRWSGGGTGGAGVGGEGAMTAGGGGTGGGTGGTSSGAGGGGFGGSSGGTGGDGGQGGGTGPHSIGGVVSGLFGSGLTLANNGDDELAIANDGPFTFGTALPSGASYDVTVVAQPVAPEQTCTVAGGKGKVGSSDVTGVAVECELLDSDGDSIPDLADPFPKDGAIPKPALGGTVYPHTASQLFTMDVKTYAISLVGSFSGATFSGSMTDMAIDQYGVLYGVTFGDLFVCDAANAQCWKLATLPQSFNGLTMVPPGTIDPMLDTLVAIANSGAWYRVQLLGNGQAKLTSIGGYGNGYTSSGDAFSIDTVGTFASVDKPSQPSDVIIAVSPLDGSFIKEIGPVPGYTSLYGLAGWLGTVYGFDASGAVVKIDINTGKPTVVAQTGKPWWGAAVSTRLQP